MGRARPLTHPPSPSLTHPPTLVLPTHSPNHPLTQPPTPSLTLPLTHTSTRSHLHPFLFFLIHSPNGAAGGLILVLPQQCLVPPDTFQGSGCCSVSAVLPVAAPHQPHNDAHNEPQEYEATPATALRIRVLACNKQEQAGRQQRRQTPLKRR
jgi:hypothetical protein